MKAKWLIALSVCLMASNASAQFFTKEVTEWVEIHNINKMIQRDAQRAQKERWKIQSDVQNKIFEIQQDVVVNRGTTASQTVQAMDSYIKGFSDDDLKIAKPQVQSSGRITVAPASGGAPLRGEVFSGTYKMQTKIFGIPIGINGEEISNIADVAASDWVWESDPVSISISGFGTFDYFASFDDPSFNAILAGSDRLGVQTTFTADFDTTGVLNDDVRVTFGTGESPYAELPETSFSMEVTAVPEPAIALGAALLLINTRGRRGG